MVKIREVKVPDVGGFIRERRRAAQLSLRKLAQLAGVSNPYLSQIERGLRRPSAEILNAIAKALRISAETLYVQAGILDQSDRHDVVSAILADPDITERQKQVLVQVYESFRTETEGHRTERRGVPAEAVASAGRGSTRRTSRQRKETT